MAKDKKPGVSKSGAKPVLASKPSKGTKRTNPRLRGNY